MSWRRKRGSERSAMSRERWEEREGDEQRDQSRRKRIEALERKEDDQLRAKVEVEVTKKAHDRGLRKEGREDNSVRRFSESSNKGEPTHCRGKFREEWYPSWRSSSDREAPEELRGIEDEQTKEESVLGTRKLDVLVVLSYSPPMLALAFSKAYPNW